MGRSNRGGVIKFLCVEGKAKGSLNAGAESLSISESKDASVVNLGLDRGGGVKVTISS